MTRSDSHSHDGSLSRHSVEFDWIANWTEQLRAAHQQIGNADARGSIGIGDDAALVPTGSDGVLVATDSLLDGVHFDHTAEPEQVGHKALAVNLSDIAAMGGVPKAATVAMSLPHDCERRWVDRVVDGLARTAARYECHVVGGDTTSWKGPFAITVTVVGEPGPQGVITRSGAKPGDRLFVTGDLGGSLHGHHLSFEPRLDLVDDLLPRIPIHAMIDLSDGLASDLRHLVRASGCGAEIDVERLPIRHVPGHALNWENALTDGEDFELLIAVGPDGATNLGDSIVEIGRVTPDATIAYFRGEKRLDRPDMLGYSHTLGQQTPKADESPSTKESFAS